MSDSRQRFEELLNEQKHILGMPKLTGAWPAFNSGYEAGKRDGVAAAVRRCAELVLQGATEHGATWRTAQEEAEGRIRAEFPEAWK